MFFILSKTASYLLLPSNLLIVLILLGLLLMILGRPRAGTTLAGAAFVLLLLIGYLPVGYYAAHILEQRFPPWNPARGAPDGIVILGGVIDGPLSRARRQTEITDSAERVTIIAKLARDYPKARIIFTSGDASLLGNEVAEANYLYPLLDTFGVPRARVELEKRARNTYENAVFSKELAKPKPGERWLLVTSARHMPRAIGCFRRVGFPVEAYPVDYTTFPRPRVWGVVDFGGGLKRTDDSAHEWLGLLAYRLTGRTSELLPGPRPAT
jgi:uncharacterized SAM-binding protein YcdF (DUF218 family)